MFPNTMGKLKRHTQPDGSAQLLQHFLSLIPFCLALSRCCFPHHPPPSQPPPAQSQSLPRVEVFHFFSLLSQPPLFLPAALTQTSQPSSCADLQPFAFFSCGFRGVFLCSCLWFPVMKNSSGVFGEGIAVLGWSFVLVLVGFALLFALLPLLNCLLRNAFFGRSAVIRILGSRVELVDFLLNCALRNAFFGRSVVIRTFAVTFCNFLQPT